MATQREQILVDIVFAVATASYVMNRKPKQITRYYNTQLRENHMRWAAKQLREMGFDTKAAGMSWGVLTDDDTKEARLLTVDERVEDGS